MKVDKAKNVPAGLPKEQDAKGVTMRVLLSEKDGAPNFIMRVFEIEPGGYTPFHAHPWEHEVYVLKGEGIVREKGTDHTFKKGYFALVAAGEEHQFVNTGDEPFRFICVIPIVRPRE